MSPGRLKGEGGSHFRPRSFAGASCRTLSLELPNVTTIQVTDMLASDNFFSRIRSILP